MSVFKYKTPVGLEIVRTKTPIEIEEALAGIRSKLKEQAGALFSSGYEYPGRYSRWDIGFTNPPLELIAWGRNFEVRSRNERGKVLIDILEKITGDLPALKSLKKKDGQLSGVLHDMPDFFYEEERSRQPSLFSVLRRWIECFGHEQDQYLGLYGAFGYDLVFQFDPINLRHKRDKIPDAKLYLPDEIMIVDRRMEKAFALRYDFNLGDLTTINIASQARKSSTVHKSAAKNVKARESKGEYAEKVKKIQAGCRRGDYFEVVLSQKFEFPFKGDALDVFEIIQERNPSPYEFILQFEDEQLVGASPEMFVRVEGKKVETCPISGTVARGESPLEDAEQIKQLLSSEKEEAELTMCTDVDRNDKSRVCLPESITVLGRRLIEVYSKVIHTVDHVEGILKPDMDGLDAFLSHMWAVTLSGSPKRAAMQAIENLEDSPRGWYGGAVGALLFNGDINTGITIRTVHLKDGLASIRVGATLLAASDPESEERETEIKAEAFINAVVKGKKAEVEQAPKMVPHGRGKKVLFVDHQDSFVHTLSGYVRRTGAEVLTVRSGFPEKVMDDFRPDLIFLSPGPFTPEHFGLPDFILNQMKKEIPMFGVCLGMQGMVQAMGGELGVLDVPRHGVPAWIEHNKEGVFKGLPSPMKASRYHSLYAIKDQVPEVLQVTARSEDGVVMGVAHKSYPMAGVQFHPESIHALGQEAGLKLINQVIAELI